MRFADRLLTGVAVASARIEECRVLSLEREKLYFVTSAKGAAEERGVMCDPTAVRECRAEQ